MLRSRPTCMPPTRTLPDVCWGSADLWPRARGTAQPIVATPKTATSIQDQAGCSSRNVGSLLVAKLVLTASKTPKSAFRAARTASCQRRISCPPFRQVRLVHYVRNGQNLQSAHAGPRSQVYKHLVRRPDCREPMDGPDHPNVAVFRSNLDTVLQELSE